MEGKVCRLKTVTVVYTKQKKQLFKTPFTLLSHINLSLLLRVTLQESLLGHLEELPQDGLPHG